MAATSENGPREAIEGDVVPGKTPDAIEDYLADEAFDDAAEEHASVVRQVLEDAGPDDGLTVAEWLNAVLEGTSPAEFARLRSTILEQDDLVYGTVPLNSDDELVEFWQSGIYPYRNLMGRRAYEHEKYRLQVELLKLQAWVKDSRQRVIILFEGRDLAGFVRETQARIAKEVSLPPGMTIFPSTTFADARNRSDTSS